ncbi:MAG: discoidin domain-containing protein [Polyangiaceae bacterium]|jgi:hypothetical protein
MTVSALSFLTPLREFFVLERAERTAAGYSPLQYARVTELRSAALERLVEARRTPSPLAACVLSREAVAFLARCRVAARDGSLDDQALSRLDGADEVPDLDPDPRDGTKGDGPRVREALASRDPLYLDGLSPENLARLGIALDRAAVSLLRSIEARSPGHIHALRRGRFAALVLVAVYVMWLAVRSQFMPVNISAGKPVHATSAYPNSPPAHYLVDGHSGFAYGAATNVEDAPRIEIDLQGEFTIDRIEVYNRTDGWWDECLPLLVELSEDGKSYTQIGRREERFGADIPWTVAGSGRPARYVRFSLARRNYLALGRVEVFGMKRKP